MQHKQERDGRWAKQFGDFAEHMTMYVMGQLNNMSVALIDHVGADVIAIKRDGSEERYAVSVKGRNIPPTEGKSRHWLSEIRKCDNILYYEIQFTEMLA